MLGPGILDGTVSLSWSGGGLICCFFQLLPIWPIVPERLSPLCKRIYIWHNVLKVLLLARFSFLFSCSNRHNSLAAEKLPPSASFSLPALGGCWILALLWCFDCLYWKHLLSCCLVQKLVHWIAGMRMESRDVVDIMSLTSSCCIL